MNVYASPDTLPELQGFLSRFQVRFHRPEARAALERYTTGLLTALPNKNAIPWRRPSLTPVSSVFRGSPAPWPGMRKTSTVNEYN
jgi:hypothetical protein